MDRKVDAVVAGHVCLDIIPAMSSGGSAVGELLRPGKLLHVGKPSVSSGGPVSNTGLALHRLGAAVRLMGKCGDDPFGRMLVERIRDRLNGSAPGMQIVPGETTSYSVVLCPPGIDRIILHCPGANDTFDPAEIDVRAVAPARLFHFGYPPLMARTYADGGEDMATMFARVKAARVTTSLDMSLPDPAALSGQADWRTILDKALPQVDLFVPSAEELLFMLKRPAFDALLSQADDHGLLGRMSGALLSEMGERCIAAGAGVVLIKCGYLGAYVRTAGRKRIEKIGRAKPGNPDSWADREFFEPSYRVLKVVSAAGAGDNAIAGFLAAYLRGLSVEDTVRYACMTGAHNLTVPDAVSGVKNWEETTADVQSGWPKNEVSIPLDGWVYDEAARHFRGPQDRTYGCC